MRVSAETFNLVPGTYQAQFDNDNKSNSDIATTTRISSSNHYHCHPHHYQLQASAAVGDVGQLVVVVRVVDDLWYLVPVVFFSSDAPAQSNSNVCSRCPRLPQQPVGATTTTTTTRDKLLLALVLSWW